MIASRGEENPDPIEAYLDEMLARMRGTASDVRRTLGECESHLREWAETAGAAGLSADESARAAVAAFGSPRRLAADFNHAHRRQTLHALLPGLVIQAWRLSAVGLTAIGVSGAFAWLLSTAVGAGPIFADPPGTHYDAASCAHFLAVQPAARTCRAAALLEGRDDALFQRTLVGLLGLALLAAFLCWRSRNGPGRQRRADLDLTMAGALVGAALFGAAGLGLTAYGIDRVVLNTGAGQWLSAGAVALAVAVAYLLSLWRTVTAVHEA